jgi:AraC-like DNA-binding protein
MYYLKSNRINSIENISVYKPPFMKMHEKHMHDFFEFVYIYYGYGIHAINDEKYNVKKGDLLIINYDESHSFTSLDEMRFVNCLINPSFFGDTMIDSYNAFDILKISSFSQFNGIIEGNERKVSFFGKEVFEIEELMDKMINEFNGKKDGYVTVLKAYVNIILTKMFRKMSNNDEHCIRQDYDKMIPEILKYINNNYNHNISLTELARRCYFSPSYFSRIFKECFGMSFIEYMNEIRMKKALELLEKTEQSNENIAFEVGYKDKKQFYILFKNKTGMTPNQYRKLK